jgi:hypothetical protein
VENLTIIGSLKGFSGGRNVKSFYLETRSSIKDSIRDSIKLFQNSFKLKEVFIDDMGHQITEQNYQSVITSICNFLVSLPQFEKLAIVTTFDAAIVADPFEDQSVDFHFKSSVVTTVVEQDGKFHYSVEFTRRV